MVNIIKLCFARANSFFIIYSMQMYANIKRHKTYHGGCYLKYAIVFAEFSLPVFCVISSFHSIVITLIITSLTFWVTIWSLEEICHVCFLCSLSININCLKRYFTPPNLTECTNCTVVWDMLGWLSLTHTHKIAKFE